MANPNDATIDMIPLTSVTSRTGARKIDSNSPNGYGRQPSFPQSQGNEKDQVRKRFPAGRRRKIVANERGNRGEDGEEDTMTQMGKIYDKILNFSIITRYFLYVLPLAVIIAIPIIIDATREKKATLGGVRLTWFFAWVEIVWLSFIGDPIFSGWMGVDIIGNIYPNYDPKSDTAKTAGQHH
ncbi:MAG: hypothetical protein Q9183_006426 [Haloplaca sp. 2 TL-2023]